MEKKTIKQLIIGGILLALYLILALAIPFPKTAAYWVAFVFGLIAICAQAYVMHVAFNQGEPVKSKFYGFPIARIGVIYLIVQLIVSFLIMALGFAFRVPAWAALIVCVLILGVSAIGFIAADIMRDEVERQDAKIKTDVMAMRALQSKAASLPGLCADDEAKKALSALAEKFRFSDPVSSDAVAALEADLAAALDELQTAVVDGDDTAAKQLCVKIEAKLNERNRLCKLNK